MPSAVAKGVALLVLFGGVSPAAGQNNVFANRAALLVARNSSLSSADSTVLGPHEQQQHASASHGRELQLSPGCRSDICVDHLNDCYAPGNAIIGSSTSCRRAERGGSGGHGLLNGRSIFRCGDF